MVPNNVREDPKHSESKNEEDDNNLNSRVVVDGHEINTCNICLQNLVSDDQEEEVISLECDIRHIFHKSCITEWLKRKKT